MSPNFGAWLVALLLATVGLALARWARGRRTSEVKIITVIDGDTCVAVDRSGFRAKLRLRGIDAPEAGQRHAAEAKALLSELTLDKWVRVRRHGRDRYRRELVMLSADGRDVCSVMLRSGLAFPDTSMAWARFAALPARLMWRGVWGLGKRRKPHQSLRRRSRLLGWLMWKRDTRRRTRARRK